MEQLVGAGIGIMLGLPILIVFGGIAGWLFQALGLSGGRHHTHGFSTGAGWGSAGAAYR